jgi:hypothetical protein
MRIIAYLKMSPIILNRIINQNYIIFYTYQRLISIYYWRGEQVILSRARGIEAISSRHISCRYVSVNVV